MAKRAFGVVLDDDAKRRLSFARQPDGAVALKPEFDIQTDAPSVFPNLHDRPQFCHCPKCRQRLAMNGAARIMLSMGVLEKP